MNARTIVRVTFIMYMYFFPNIHSSPHMPAMTPTSLLHFQPCISLCSSLPVQIRGVGVCTIWCMCMHSCQMFWLCTHICPLHSSNVHTPKLACLLCSFLARSGANVLQSFPFCIASESFPLFLFPLQLFPLYNISIF